MEDQELPQGILNVNVLMDLICVTRQTLISYIKEGKIPAYRLSPGKYLISSRQLIKTIESKTGKFETEAE